MATRLYFDRDRFDPTSTPTFNNPTASYIPGSWDDETGFRLDMKLITSSELSDSGFLTRSVSTSSSAGTILHALAISAPMSNANSWTLSTLHTFNFRISEASTSQDCFLQNRFYIINNDGSQVMYSLSLMKDNTEAGTTLGARLNNGSFTQSPGNYTNAIGDRIVIEVGWDKDGAVSGSIGISYGDSTTSGDLSTGTDTTVKNPWYETDNNVTFDAEGTVYSTNKNLLMMMGCGT